MFHEELQKDFSDNLKMKCTVEWAQNYETHC